MKGTANTNKQIRTKIEQNMRVNYIWSNLGKLVVVPKSPDFQEFQNYLQTELHLHISICQTDKFDIYYIQSIVYLITENL